jgi:hypothetical protein
MHTHDGSHIDAYDSYDNTIIEIKWAYIPTKNIATLPYECKYGMSP